MCLIKLYKWFNIQFKPERKKGILSFEEIVYKIKNHDYISVDKKDLDETLSLSSQKIKKRLIELDKQIHRSKEFNEQIDEILEIIIKKSEDLDVNDKAEVVKLLTKRYNDYLRLKK